MLAVVSRSLDPSILLAHPAPLDHAAYVDAACLAEEQAWLFAGCWLFAGLSGDFGSDPVAIGTAGHTVKIFCRNGHWQAAAQGKPAAVALCGNLVFYSLAADPPPLAAWLAPFFETARDMSRYLTATDLKRRRTVAANWKLVAENALDDYHVAAVHPTTLYPTMVKGGERRVGLERDASGHSLWRNELGEADATFWARTLRRLEARAFDAADDYRHLFLFPNAYIASFKGVGMILHRLDPLDAGRTAIDLHFCLPLAGEATPARLALKRAVLEGFAAKADAVLNEDIAICEAVQRGQRYAFQPSLLGGREPRIGDFQAAVLAALAR